MATKKCRHCQTEIDAKARVCPQCHGKLGTSGLLLGMGAGTGCLAIVLVSIVGGMFVCTSVMQDAASSVEEAREAEQRRLNERTPEQMAIEEKQKVMDEGITEAQIQCPRAIKAQLKAPATAEMPHISRSSQRSGSFVATASEDASVVRVMTYVDSQNSFGATIRTKFQCDLKKTDGRWVIIKLQVIE